MTNTWPSGRRCRSMNSFSGRSRYAASEERWKEEIIHHLRPADYNKALKKSTTWSSQSTFDHLVENENSLITSVNPFVNSTLKSLDLAISTPQCCSGRQCSQSRDVCTNHCFHCVQCMGCCVMLLLCNTIYNKLPLANLIKSSGKRMLGDSMHLARIMIISDWISDITSMKSPGVANTLLINTTSLLTP